jgi:hypothetical protein
MEKPKPITKDDLISLCSDWLGQSSSSDMSQRNITDAIFEVAEQIGRLADALEKKQ